MTLTDPTGYILTTIRDNAAVAALTTRIRGGEPAPGDALGPGAYVPFVVLTQLGRTRETRVPVQEVRILAKCYAATHQAAAALAGAVSDAVHHVGPRRNSTGVLIWASFDDGGEGGTKDPDTGQPMSSVVISVTAATQLVTP
jgi:hypothetical protein